MSGWLDRPYDFTFGKRIPGLTSLPSWCSTEYFQTCTASLQRRASAINSDFARGSSSRNALTDMGLISQILESIVTLKRVRSVFYSDRIGCFRTCIAFSFVKNAQVIPGNTMVVSLTKFTLPGVFLNESTMSVIDMQLCSPSLPATQTVFSESLYFGYAYALLTTDESTVDRDPRTTSSGNFR